MSATMRPLGRVLRGAEWGLYGHATEALAIAQHQAAALRATTEAEIAQERERLRGEIVTEAQQEATRLLAQTAAGVQRELAAMRLAIAETIALGVTRIIGEMDVAEAVARVTIQAVNGLRERSGIAVHVAPGQAAAVQARLAACGPAITIIADSALGDGDCTVQTQAGFVRAGLETQIAALRNALIEAVA